MTATTSSVYKKRASSETEECEGPKVKKLRSPELTERQVSIPPVPRTTTRTEEEIKQQQHSSVSYISPYEKVKQSPKNLKPSGGKKVDWTQEEDSNLRDAVLRCRGNWQEIPDCIVSLLKSETTQKPTPEECKRRWHDVVALKSRKGPWTAEEDELVCNLVKHYGPRKWSTLATNIPGRNGKQIRERWVNHLSPDVSKQKWTEEEEELLVQQHGLLGNKWSQIAKHIPGRSENDVKNRWNSRKLNNDEYKRSRATVRRAKYRESLKKNDNKSTDKSKKRAAKVPATSHSTMDIEKTQHPGTDPYALMVASILQHKFLRPSTNSPQLFE